MIKEILLLNFIKKYKKLNDNTYFKISEGRNFKINKNLLGMKVAIHNGKYYIPIKIMGNMFLKYFGSFSFSFNILLKKKKKKYIDKKKKK